MLRNTVFVTLGTTLVVIWLRFGVRSGILSAPGRCRAPPPACRQCAARFLDCDAKRYAKTKDTAYTKIIADKGLNLHYRSAVMETYGAFGDSLWGIVTELTDPNTHPRASGDYDPWSRPDPRRDFILSLAFAQQRGNAVMLRQASARRLRNRAGGRHATGARA